MKLIKGYSAPLFVALCSLGLASCFAPAIETLEYLRVAGPEPVTDWSQVEQVARRNLEMLQSNESYTQNKMKEKRLILPLEPYDATYTGYGGLDRENPDRWMGLLTISLRWW